MEKYVNEYCTLVDEFKRQLEKITLNILEARNQDADKIQRLLQEVLTTNEQLKESQERLHQAYDDLARLTVTCSRQQHYIKALEAKINERSKK